jgi:type II secretory pathway pseudopilin PulG
MKNLKKIKKRSITLLEIMIVIFLIGIIGSAIGYNMKGSIDKGKKFKTEQAQKQVRDVLLLEHASGNVTFDEVLNNPQSVLEGSGLIKDAGKLLTDGWGNVLEIKRISENEDDIVITSKGLDAFNKKNKKVSGKRVKR